MSFRRLSALLTGVTCSLILASALPLHAQDAPPEAGQLPDPKTLGIEELFKQSVELMRAKRWADALVYCEAAVETYGVGAKDAFGPKFGGFYFRKGVCELKLGKWDEAMKSFETCYTEFANKKGADVENPFEKTCLLPWAEAAMGKEDWQLALDLYDKFVKERDRDRDDLPQASYFINRSICFYNLGKLAEGNENLEIAIKNKAQFRVPDVTILGAFRYMMQAAIKERNEQALLDFIAKNRGEVTFDPFDSYPFASFYMKLATDAIKAGMSRAALEIYMLVPSTEMALADARTKLESLGPRPGIRQMDGGVLVKEQLEQGIKQLEESERSGKAVEMIKIAAIAYLHEQHGNYRGAYAAYRLLEDYYPKSESRESNLFNLARLSFIVDFGRINLDDAERFLKFFPASTHAPQIEQLMLNSLFARREYEKCIELAGKQIGLMQEGTPSHDLCLHVLGGSYYYTGRYDEAQPLLDQHVAKYPDSGNKVAAAYFQASNAYRRQDFGTAVKLLGDFINKHPDPKTNTYLPFAYFDKASSQYYLDQNDEALNTVNQLLENFAATSLADQANNLRGNILLGMEKATEAELAYKSGLSAAERSGNTLIIGESLYNLVGLILSASEGKPQIERGDEAAGYIDKFWNACGENSPYATLMAVRQLPVLEQVKRLEEGLKLLESAITRVSNSDNPSQLEGLQMLDAYTEYFLKIRSAEELKDKYANFPGVGVHAKEPRALMLIQVISVFEELGRKAKERDAKLKADATVKALFEQLKRNFQVTELTSGILIKVGNYLRTKTSTPREALPFYNEVIERNDPSERYAALLGRADIFGSSPNAADIDKALADFKSIIDDIQAKKEPSKDDANQLEFAMFRTIQLLMGKKEYQQVRERALAFLDDKNGYPRSKHASEASLLLGKAYEGLNLTEDAIAIYNKTASGTTIGGVTAQALMRWMELVWNRNKPAPNAMVHGDRQGAYVRGAKFLGLTSSFKARMNDTDLEIWKQLEELVKQYEANPNIKSLKELEEEKK